MIVVTMGELATYYTTVKRFADKPRRPLYVSVGHTNDQGQTWVKLGYWQYRVDASDKCAMERMQYLGRDNGAWADYERGLLLAERLLCEVVTPGLSSGADWSQPCHIDGMVDGQQVRFIVTDYNCEHDN